MFWLIGCFDRYTAIIGISRSVEDARVGSEQAQGRYFGAENWWSRYGEGG